MKAVSLIASQVQQNINSLNSGTVIGIFVVVAIAVAAIIYAEFLDRNPKFKLDSYCFLLFKYLKICLAEKADWGN